MSLRAAIAAWQSTMQQVAGSPRLLRRLAMTLNYISCFKYLSASLSFVDFE